MRAGRYSGFRVYGSVGESAFAAPPYVGPRRVSAFHAAATIESYHKETIMITTIDKALVAVVGGIVTLGSAAGWWPVEAVTSQWIAGLAAVVSPILVYFIPNTKAVT